MGNNFIGIIGVVIGSALTFLGEMIKRFLDRTGKLCVSIRFVACKDTEQLPNVIRFQKDYVINIPMWIEFVNSKGTAMIIRNVNIYAYYRGIKKASFSQIQKSDKYQYGNNELYSFVIPEKSVSRYDLLFILKKTDASEQIDEIRLGYYDDRNKFHEKTILNLKDAWREGSIPIEKDWIPV